MNAPEITRWSPDEMLRLAASGVAKVDLLGPRGSTLCSMDEIAAMAAASAGIAMLRAKSSVMTKRWPSATVR